MRVAVLSDTHGPRRWTSCPAAVADQLRDVDLILHAGDVCNVEVLEELSEFAPVHVVLGNNDGAEIAAWGAPLELTLDLEGVTVTMVHDTGESSGRTTRLRRLFPDSDLVIFGHSHIPWDELDGPQRSFNPGSPTDRRRQPRGTMGLLEIAAGDVRATQIVAVT